jgi:class 3 adenylate cyclase
LDYSRRCVSFGFEFLSLVERFNQENDFAIRPRISIACGGVVSGLIGKEDFTYSLWGDPVNIASRGCYEAKLNSLLITQAVYEQLEDKEAFNSHPALELPGIGSIELWEHCT